MFLSQSLSSCKKLKPFSQENIYFSKDTVVFDTVFTTVGSTTQQFKIYNPSNKAVKIEEIELMGGANSPFRMNVDGVKGTNLGEMILEGKDSLFAFVEVTLSVNGQNLPLIIEDSIRFRTNGKDQYVKLAVWGQDAYFHYKDLNEGTWPNDKPHVIYGYAAVDSSKTLTIPAGTNIYLHKNALLYVYKGSLQVQGMLNQEVVFQGDRLEAMYDDIPGQYYGIYFHEALPSSIDYAIIKNGTAGVHLFSEAPTNTGYTLQLTNTRIFNMSRYGVFIYSGAKVRAENCIVSRNETHALLVLEGGDFNFNHCNLLGFGPAKASAVGISNYYSNPISGITNVGSIHEGTMTNCVIYGTNDFNLAIDTLHMNGITLNLQFANCLIRSDSVFSDPFYTNVLWNQNPLFENTNQGDFLYLPNSPLHGNGLNTGLTLDILGNPRQNPPDIGALEL
ncbi:MAG: hypothetical protein RL432_834 [Bacteroidota bacterium]